MNDNAVYASDRVVLVAGKPNCCLSRAAYNPRPQPKPQRHNTNRAPQQTHRHLASDGSAYKEYVLIECGRAVFPIVVSMRQWGEQHLFQTGEVHSVLLDKAREQPVVAFEVRSAEG